jgi:hypothetical protein
MTPFWDGFACGLVSYFALQVVLSGAFAWWALIDTAEGKSDG